MSDAPIPMRELAAALVLAGHEVHMDHVREISFTHCGTIVAYSVDRPATHWPCEVWGPDSRQQDGEASSIADVLYLLDPDEDRARARERADWTAGRVLSEEDDPWEITSGGARSQIRALRASMDSALVDKLTKATRERDEAITALLDLTTKHGELAQRFCDRGQEIARLKERDAAIKRAEEVRDAAHASTNALRFAALDALGVIPQPPGDAAWNERSRGFPEGWQDDGTLLDAHRITAEAVATLAAKLHQSEQRADVEPLLSITARVAEAGGTAHRKPGVTLEHDGGTITLLCTAEQARLLGAHLYREVTLTLSPAPATVPTDGAGEGVP